MQDGRGRSCIATLLYCERGACGPDGACCSSTFLSVSSTPPEVGGATRRRAAPAGTCVAGAPRIEAGLRSTPASQASAMLVRKKIPCQDRRRPRQQIGGAAARHEACAAAHAEAAAFGFLQQHGAISTETIMR